MTCHIFQKPVAGNCFQTLQLLRWQNNYNLMSHGGLHLDDAHECTWLRAGCCLEEAPHLQRQRNWLRVTAHLVCVCAASAELWMGTEGCALRRHRIGSEMRAIYSTARLHWSTEQERDFQRADFWLNNLKWNFPVNLLHHGAEDKSGQCEKGLILGTVAPLTRSSSVGHQQHVSSKTHEEPLQIHRGDTTHEEGHFFSEIPSMQTRAGKGEGVSPRFWHTIVLHWATKVMTQHKATVLWKREINVNVCLVNIPLEKTCIKCWISRMWTALQP